MSAQWLATNPGVGSSQPIRRTTVRAACDACRAKKSRCSGERPSCASCIKRNVKCVYGTDTAGETRQAAARRRLTELEKSSSKHQRLLKNIRSATADDASAALRHIRAGNDPNDFFTDDEFGTPLSRMSSSAESRHLSEQGAVAVLEALSSGTDEDSSMLLARLRVGEPWEDIAVSLLRAAASPAEPSGGRLYEHFRSETSPTSSTAALGQQEVETHATDDDMVYESDVPELTSVFNRSPWTKTRQSARRQSYPASDDRPPSTTRSDVVAFAPIVKDHLGQPPFSHSVWPNQLSTEVQQIQFRDIFLPVWTMRTMNKPSAALDPFDRLFADLSKDIASGVDAETLCGPHAFVNALDDEATFARAPKLSQVVANMVKSFNPGDLQPSITKYATMWLHWTLWKWMFSPSPQTYRDMPALIRPTPYQLLAFHSRACDFILSPALRDHMCQLDDPDYAWMREAGITAQCSWPRSIPEALCEDGSTGEIDLNVICKTHVGDPRSWSLGPSVRPFLPNADRYFNIRLTE